MSVGIVTGAARGMGAACAARLAGMVDILVVADRDEAGLAAAAAQLSGRDPGFVVEPVVLDVADGEAVARLVERARALGPLRAVAHAAGVSPTMAAWRDVLAVDLVGTALLVDALHPLATEGTAIVCFASISASLALPDTDLPADAVLDEPLHRDFLGAHPGVRRPRGRGPGHGLHLGEAGRAPPGAA